MMYITRIFAMCQRKGTKEERKRKEVMKRTETIRYLVCTGKSKTEHSEDNGEEYFHLGMKFQVLKHVSSNDLHILSFYWQSIPFTDMLF